MEKVRSRQIAILEQSLLLTRQLLLLNTLHNLVFYFYIPVVKIFAIATLYISIAIAFIYKDQFIGVLGIFIYIYIAFVFVLLAFGSFAMSQVYAESKAFHERVNIFMVNLSYPQRNDVLRIRQAVKSLPMMKSQVGPFYYMESQAKLTLVDNLLNGIAFMFITFK